MIVVFAHLFAQGPHFQSCCSHMFQLQCSHPFICICIHTHLTMMWLEIFSGPVNHRLWSCQDQIGHIRWHSRLNRSLILVGSCSKPMFLNCRPSRPPGYSRGATGAHCVLQGHGTKLECQLGGWGWGDHRKEISLEEIMATLLQTRVLSPSPYYLTLFFN